MPENDPPQYSDISILYVEDEDATRVQVSRILANRGYRLTVAENGLQGIELFRNIMPDIVLTDIMMPQMNGLEMARAIREISPKAQIACMTAFSDTSYLIDAIDIGVNQFVLKPVDFQHLFTALDRCQEMVMLLKRQKTLEEENLRAKKTEAIGILAGGMAHDFNNLLQVILGYVSLARMNSEPGSKTESLLSIAENSSETARELSARLLTFAKGGEAFMIPVNIIQLIRERVDAELKWKPAIKLTSKLPDDLTLVTADPDQIGQVVSNLIINACEAMPAGGSLQLIAANVTLTETNDFALAPGDFLHIILKDSGIGITHENLPNIFDPYFSTKEMGCQKGMGLGLALCQSIIKSHHGHIHAESTPGKGTNIHIYLPICHESIPKQQLTI